jgi:hypothetical protein
MNIFLIVAVGVLAIIIGREIFCWYFKINKLAELLKRIEENTRPKGLIREPIENSKDLI